MSLIHAIGPHIWMIHSEIPPAAVLYKKGTPLLKMSQPQLRERPFDFQGGGVGFFEKNILALIFVKKNILASTQTKKIV